MRVLSIETSTSQLSVALREQNATTVSRGHTRLNQSAERLLPLIAELLSEAGWSTTSIDRLGVSVGPGSFTGLRIGIACAQGLALGLDRPLVGVSSLQAMARAVPETLPGARAAVLDARRGEVFAGIYAPGPRAACLIEARALPIATAARELEAAVTEPLVWVGSGLALLDRPASSEHPATLTPHAESVGILAEELDPALHPALPVYLRDAGATLPDLGAPARATG